LRNKILLQNGIINDVDARPIPVNADCARCQLVNPFENKYCSSCGYPLSVAAYEELKAADSEELNQIKEELGKRTQEITELKAESAKWPELAKDIAEQLQTYRKYTDDNVKHMLHMRHIGGGGNMSHEKRQSKAIEYSACLRLFERNQAKAKLCVEL
jgi:hypothetical protein